jgi:TolA-binding protein
MLDRLRITCLIVSLVLPQICLAEDSDNGYWEKLKNKLSHISPQKKGQATTAVGGVRGSKASAEVLYWKGEEEILEVAEGEYAHFQEAYQSAVAGNKEEAVNKFQAFLQAFPQSPLGEDARRALKELQ